jgi:hypothetical protein
LLRLCEKLQLFVIPPPGPYIFAKVQAGGCPLWLIAKRELPVQHLLHPPLCCASPERRVPPILR